MWSKMTPAQCPGSCRHMLIILTWLSALLEGTAGLGVLGGGGVGMSVFWDLLLHSFIHSPDRYSLSTYILLY